MTKPIPDGYNSVTPYLVVDDAKRAIEFYRDAFGAEEKFRLPMGDRIGHAEIKIGDSPIMLADEFPEMGMRSPSAVGGSPVTISLYIDDVDGVFERAVQGGAKPLRQVENQFYGDRVGSFEDPFGHRWSVATHVEDVPPDEMERRAAEAMDGGG